MRKQVTSEELEEVRSVGISLGAGVTLAILGLSLLNSFRMGVHKKGDQNGTTDEGIRVARA
jgi:hypothetical protein